MSKIQDFPKNDVEMLEELDYLDVTS
jgi:hypothetical protein